MSVAATIEALGPNGPVIPNRSKWFADEAYAELLFTERMWPDFGPDDLAEAGVKAIRQDFLWKRIEPQRGVYDFSYEDALVAAAAAIALIVGGAAAV